MADDSDADAVEAQSAFEDSDTDEWLVEWPETDREPSERITTLPFVAWYASEHDDEAEVTAL